MNDASSTGSWRGGEDVTLFAEDASIPPPSPPPSPPLKPRGTRPIEPISMFCHSKWWTSLKCPSSSEDVVAGKVGVTGDGEEDTIEEDAEGEEEAEASVEDANLIS